MIVNAVYRLTCEVWLWEKEQSHRLFNFQEGYRVDEQRYQIVGSNVIVKRDDGEIQVLRAREYEQQPPKKRESEDEKDNPLLDFKRNDKLVNVIYTDSGTYHLFEPQNVG